MLHRRVYMRDMYPAKSIVKSILFLCMNGQTESHEARLVALVELCAGPDPYHPIVPFQVTGMIMITKLCVPINAGHDPPHEAEFNSPRSHHPPQNIPVKSSTY